MKKGLIHIYTGDGKGKTTASLGLSVRASGHGFKVIFAQFLKGSASSEDNSIKLLPNITHIKDVECKKFTFQMNEQELLEVTNEHNKMFDKIVKLSNEYDLIVLDEIISTYNLGLINKEKVLDFLKNKPENLEIALTGREPSNDILEISDYVSEIKAIKHPFEQGIGARKGIEY